ncbi:MAG: two-component system, sensor histidine kinase and response regulator, partial [Aliidongia sp.]|nr:two-component system, sensor histidine kinase and response regulator [Aliidongia sp.]
QEVCLAAGMDDYVSKPFNASAFLDTVAHWLGAGTAAKPDSVHDGGGEEISALLDGKRLDLLARMMPPAKLAALLRTCVAGDGERLGLIGSFGRAADLGNLAHEAHALKSVYGNLGAHRLQHALDTLEAASDAGDLPRAQEIIDHLPLMFRETWAMMRERLAALDAMAQPERIGG